MNLTILILAAGQSSKKSADEIYPLCLTEVEGLSLLERIINTTKEIKNAIYTFAFLRKEVEQFHLDKVANLLAPGAEIYKISEKTQGSACTSLLATSQLNQENELLIISANELVEINLNEIVENFRKRKLDCGILTFHSIHPRYSYVKVNEEKHVTEAAQQDPISNNATTGIFWFSKTKIFVEAVKETIRKNANINNNFYIAPSLNELILKHYKVGVVTLDVTKYIPLKNERQIQKFEDGSNL